MDWYKNIISIVKEPLKSPIVTELNIENNDSDMLTFPSDEHIIMLIDKDTVDKDNIFIPSMQKFISGTIIFVGYENKSIISLTAKQIVIILKYINRFSAKNIS